MIVGKTMVEKKGSEKKENAKKEFKKRRCFGGGNLVGRRSD